MAAPAGGLADICRALAPTPDPVRGAAHLQAMSALALRVYQALGGQEELAQWDLSLLQQEVAQLEGRELLALVRIGARRAQAELAQASTTTDGPADGTRVVSMAAQD